MKTIAIFIVFSALWASAAFGAHPLITDDTGTQGKGKYQAEMNSQFDTEKETSDGVGFKETAGEAAAVVSAGVSESADIVLGVPFAWSRAEEDGVVSEESGLSDISLELKWRFYEKDGLSLALKPAIVLPTGDEAKGLGNGSVSYGVTFITTKSSGPWEFHFNLGYAHNEYELAKDEAANRKGIWHISFAPVLDVAEGLKAVANIGMESNPDNASDTHPAFILGGLIYSVSDDLDIDVGIKAGLNKPETDTTILAGMAFRF
ncbi:transporter [bacterium]|nr:MAG: transporter [bacterium]